MGEGKDFDKATHLVFWNKTLLTTKPLEEVQDWSTAVPTTKDGRNRFAAVSTGKIEQAIEISRSTGARIIVVVDTEQVMMRDAVWYTPLVRFGLELGELVWDSCKVNVMNAGPPKRLMIIRAQTNTYLGDPEIGGENYTGARAPRMIRAWQSALYEIPLETLEEHDAALKEADSWVAYQHAINSVPSVLTCHDFRALEREERLVQRRRETPSS